MLNSRQQPSSSGSWLDRLKRGLKKTGSQLTGLFGGTKVDEQLFEDLESALISADAGLDASRTLIERLRTRARKERIETPPALKEALATELAALLAPLERPFSVTAHKPFVIMIAGVNGSGKTTSIGKLAKWLQSQGHSRCCSPPATPSAPRRASSSSPGASATACAVIAQEGGDPAAVIFDAIQRRARARHRRGHRRHRRAAADPAPPDGGDQQGEARGRRRREPGAPHEVLLVLDANTGQNALAQVKAFDDALGLTGLVLTKLDGTAKGGVVGGIAAQRPVPLAVHRRRRGHRRPAPVRRAASSRGRSSTDRVCRSLASRVGQALPRRPRGAAETSASRSRRASLRSSPGTRARASPRCSS